MTKILQEEDLRSRVRFLRGKEWCISACTLGPANITSEMLMDSHMHVAPDVDTPHKGLLGWQCNTLHPHHREQFWLCPFITPSQSMAQPMQNLLCCLDPQGCAWIEH